MLSVCVSSCDHTNEHGHFKKKERMKRKESNWYPEGKLTNLCKVAIMKIFSLLNAFQTEAAVPKLSAKNSLSRFVKGWSHNL